MKILPQIKIFFVLAFGILGMFFAHEFFINRNSNFIIFCEKNASFLKTPKKQIISFGNIINPNSQMVLRAIHPYFSNNKIIEIEKQKKMTELSVDDTKLQIFSPNIARAQFNNQIIWLIGEPDEEEIRKLKSQPISFSSNFWILKKNIFLNFLSAPKDGILYLNDRKPSEKLKTFVKEKNILIIAVKDTNGFSLSLQKNRWQLKTRQ